MLVRASQKWLGRKSSIGMCAESNVSTGASQMLASQSNIRVSQSKVRRVRVKLPSRRKSNAMWDRLRLDRCTDSQVNTYIYVNKAKVNDWYGEKVDKKG